MQFGNQLNKENINQNSFFNHIQLEPNSKLSFQLMDNNQKYFSSTKKKKQHSATSFQVKLKFIKKQVKLKKTHLLNQKHVRQALREITQKIKKQLQLQNQEISLLNFQKTFQTNQNTLIQKNIEPLFFSPDRKQQNKQQYIILESKLKKSQIIYPIFRDQCIASQNLNSLIIQRQLDNDVSSDEKQMEAGICHLYCELFTSQKKQNQFKKQFDKVKKQINKVQQRLFR